MNVTLIKNGCKTTTSNGLTAVLVNDRKSAGVDCLPQVKFCACEFDGTEKDFRERYSSPSSWPWYDPNDSASEEYLGSYVSNVDGLSKVTDSRVVADTLGSGYASSCKKGRREMVVSGLMFATSERGMAYGRRWERERWWSKSCDCHNSTVTFRVDCSGSSFDFVELNRVVAVSGPTFKPAHESGKCCDVVGRFEVTLNALDPDFYSESSNVFGEYFDPSQYDFEEWECDSVEHSCGPECCEFCVNDLVLFDVQQSCCYCQPLLVTRLCKSFDAVPSGLSVGFDFEFYSGSSVFENASVLFVEGDCSAPGCDDNRSLTGRVLGGFQLNRFAADTLVKVNGKTGEVTVLCGNEFVDGSGFVAGFSGLPYAGFRCSSDRPFSVLFEADAGSVGSDAWVKLGVFTVRSA